MSNQITTAMVQQYRANVEFLLQQKGSVLRPFVREEALSAEFEYFDRIGATTAQEKLSRHGDTPLIHTPHDRRRVSLRDFEWADLVDNPDKIRLLSSPESEYAQNAAFALGRSMDDVIIEAFTAAAETGKTGSTSTAFDSNMRIDVQYDGAGGTTDLGLTIVKLREARRLLRANLVDPTEELFVGVSAQQLDDLLATTEVTSADYNTVRALVQGEVDTFLGFKFVHTERMNTAAGEANHRDCPYWAKSGMLLGVGADIRTRMSERDDKSYSMQVYAAGSFGATRMEEGKVGMIECEEA